MNYGVRVEMRFSKNSPFRQDGVPPTQTLRNVTEIHYNYLDGNTGPNGTNPSRHEIGSESCVAFESAVHSTGVVYRLSYLAEFETFPETKKAKAF